VKSMRVAIIGSCEYKPLRNVSRYVKTLPAGTTIISGAAPGVDRIAELTAVKLGWPVEIIMGDWSLINKSTGYVRLKEVVTSADRVVAFWNGKSRGTPVSVNMARGLGKDMIVFGPSNEVLYANRKD
jgi:hypothetical protein